MNDDNFVYFAITYTAEKWAADVTAEN